jgi:hypothetical protein
LAAITLLAVALPIPAASTVFAHSHPTESFDSRLTAMLLNVDGNGRLAGVPGLQESAMLTFKA